MRIERAPLEHVLLQIARVSGRVISFPSDLVRGIWAGPIDGALDAESAALQALAGTGLLLNRLPDGTLTIGSGPDTPAPDRSAPDLGTLDTIHVHASPPALGVTETDAVTGIDTPLAALPYTVNSVSAELLEASSARTVDDALSRAGAITVAVKPSSPKQYALRGFLTDAAFTDGLPDRLATLRPVEAIEDITIVKGPNAAMAGMTSAGGAINMNLKGPTRATTGAFAVQSGSRLDSRLSADLGGALGAGLDYRTVAVLDGAQRGLGGYDGHRAGYLGAALGWRDAGTRLVAGVEALTRREPVTPFTVAVDRVPLRIPAQSPLGSASDHTESRGARVYYDLSHALSDGWTWRSRGHYVALDSEFTGWSPTGIATRPPRVMLTTNGYQNDSHVLALSNSLTGTVGHGTVSHQLSLGWDEVVERQSSHYGDTADFAVQDPFAPHRLPPVSLTPGPTLAQTVRQSVFLLQDRAALGQRWELLGALRAHVYDASLPAAHFGGVEWTPALGVAYKPDPQLAWFANVGRGFHVNTGYTYTGDTMAPQSSRQWEAGVRWTNTVQDLTVQGALYRIDARNVAIADPAHPGHYISIAQQSSHGVELSVQGALSPAVETSLWLSYARIAGPGGQTHNSLRADTWTTYTIHGGAWDGLGAGLGLRGRNASTGLDDGLPSVPGHVAADAKLFLHRKSWRIGLVIYNLFDTPIYGDTLASDFIPISAGRSVALKIAFAM